MAKKRLDTLVAQKKTLQFDTNHFFKELKNSATSFLNTEFGSAGRAVFESVVQVDNSEAGKLYTIIWEATGKACMELFKRKFKPDAFSSLGSDAFVFRQDVGRHLETIEFEIDKHFFKQPHKHPQVLVLRDVFADWMTETLGISPTHAKAAATAFPRYFLAALAETDKDTLLSVKAYFDHPIFEAYNQERLREAYHARLLRLYDSRAFGDKPEVSLADVYIEPNFLVLEHLVPKELEEQFVAPCHPKDTEKKDNGFKRPKAPLSIHTFFDDWLAGKNSFSIKNGDSSLLLLLGQPGQGKTSFCARTLYNLLSDTEGSPVFFLRLRDLEGAPTQLIEKPIEYLRDVLSKQVFDGNEMRDKDFHEAVLILDGLDELYMNKNLTHYQVNEFLNNLKYNLRRLQEYTNPINMKCVVTSRHHYVQLDTFGADDWLVLSLDNLTLEHQQTWLHQYCNFVNEDKSLRYLAGLNDVLVELDTDETKKGQELRNLVNQPILLSMIAQSEIGLDKTTDRAKIYRKMFDTLQERSWAKGQITSLKPLETDKKVQKAYRNFLQRLAIHIFQSKNEYVRKSDFKEEKTPLNTALQRLGKMFGDKSLSIEQILSSFYFKQVAKQYDDQNKADEHQNYAFEFLHKSLQEYLVAEGIWAYMIKLADKNADDEYQINNETAFKEMFTELFAPRLLTNEIVEYIQELIVENSDKTELIEGLKTRFKDIIGYLADHNFLWKYDATDKNQETNPIKQSVNMFYGFWTVASNVVIQNLGYELGTTIVDEEIDRERLRTDADLIRHSKFSAIIGDLLTILRRNNYESYLILINQDLSVADISGVYFVDVEMRGSVLSDNTIAGSYFSRVNLNSSDISRTFITYSVFAHAKLENCNFEHSRISYSRFEKTKLRNANFRDAKLVNSHFNNADLRNADFYEAKILETDFFNANLEDAIFSKATFVEDHVFIGDRVRETIKNLDQALNLDKADFSGTIFEGKIHKRADGSFWIEGYSEEEL